MLAVGPVWVRRGLELRINWPGRIAVFWVMAAIFFAQLFAGWVPTFFLYIGLAFALIATFLYARTGYLAVRETKVTPA